MCTVRPKVSRKDTEKAVMMKSQIVLPNGASGGLRGSVGARGEPGSWLTRAAVEANDRWWETLLAVRCYLEVEPRQRSQIKSKTLVCDPPPPPSDERTSAKQPEQQQINQVLEVTQRLTSLCVTAALER